MFYFSLGNRVHAVRKQILEILKENRTATVAELAKQLEMAAVSVRNHLDILQGDALICVERVQRKGNVGRPQQVYALTEAASEFFPNNFATLAEGLVRQMKAVLPPEETQRAFSALACEIAAELNCENLCADDIEERLDRVAEFLSERGYLASWEPAGDSAADGYLLHKYNCPYAGVSDAHSEICLMDQALVNKLMGCACHRQHSMTENGYRCTYQIKCQAENPADELMPELVLHSLPV